MNEEYTRKVFNKLGLDEKYYDSFKSDISSNEEYNRKVFNKLGLNEKYYDSFKQDTGFKKKVESESGGNQYEELPTSQSKSQSTEGKSDEDYVNDLQNIAEESDANVDTIESQTSKDYPTSTKDVYAYDWGGEEEQQDVEQGGTYTVNVEDTGKPETKKKDLEGIIKGEDVPSEEQSKKLTTQELKIKNAQMMGVEYNTAIQKYEDKYGKLEIPKYSSDKEKARIYSMAAKRVALDAEKEEEFNKMKDKVRGSLPDVTVNEDGSLSFPEQYNEDIDMTPADKFRIKTKESISEVLPESANNPEVIDAIYNHMGTMSDQDIDKLLKGKMEEEELDMMIRDVTGKQLAATFGDLDIISSRIKEQAKTGKVSDELLRDYANLTAKTSSKFNSIREAYNGTEETYRQLVADQRKLEAKQKELDQSLGEDASRRLYNTINQFAVDFFIKSPIKLGKSASDAYLKTFTSVDPDETYQWSDGVIDALDETIKSRPLTTGTRTVFGEDGEFSVAGAGLAAIDNVGFLAGVIGAARMGRLNAISKARPIGKVLTKDVVEKSMKDYSKVGVALGVYSQNYDAARESGLKDTEIANQALYFSTFEMLAENILPDYKLLRPSARKAAIRDLSENIAKGRIGREAAKSATRTWMKNLGTENLEEFLVEANNDIVNAVRAKSDEEFAKQYEGADMESYAEVAVVTSILSGGAASVGAISELSNAKKNAYIEASQNSDRVIPILDELAESFPEYKERVDNAKEIISEATGLTEYLPDKGEVSTESRAKLIPVAEQIRKKEEQLESKSGAEKKRLQKEIDNLNEEYNTIIEEDAAETTQEEEADTEQVDEQDTEQVEAEQGTRQEQVPDTPVREQGTRQESRQVEIVPEQEAKEGQYFERDLGDGEKAMYQKTAEGSRVLPSEEADKVVSQQKEQEIKEGDKVEYKAGEETLTAEVTEDLGDDLMVRSPEGNEFSIPKQDVTKQRQDTEQQATIEEEGETVQQEPEVVAQEGTEAETTQQGDQESEGQPVTIDDSNKSERIEEFKEAVDRGDSKKISRIKKGLQNRVKKAKEDADAKSFLADISNFIMDRLSKDKSIKLDNFSRATVKKINTRIKNATRGNLDRLSREMIDIYESAIRKKINTDLKKLIPKARKNIEKGRAGTNQAAFEGVLSINPTLIPQTDEGRKLLNDYSEVINELQGTEVKLINPDTGVKLVDKANKVFDKYSEIRESIEDASDIYLEEKSNRPDAKKADILSDLVDNGSLTQNQAAMLNEIAVRKPKKVADSKAGGKEMSDKEKEKRKFLIGSILSNKPSTSNIPEIVKSLNNKKIRPLVERLSKIKAEDLIGLKTQDLKDLNTAVVYALPSGDINSAGRALAIIQSNQSKKSIKEILGTKLSRKSLLDFRSYLTRGLRNKARLNYIRTQPLKEIGEAFGSKSADLYENTFGLLARAHGQLRTFTLSKGREMTRKVDNIHKAFNKNKKEFDRSKVKLGMIAGNREYLANQGSDNRVTSVEDNINETFRQLFGSMSKELINYKETVQGILDDYAEFDQEGNVVSIDFVAMEESLTDAEKEYLEFRTPLMRELGDMQAVSSSAIKGKKLMLMDNYMSQIVIRDKKGNRTVDMYTEPQDYVDQRKSTMGATKSGVAEERTSGAKSVVYDIFRSDYRAMSETATDYYLSTDLRSVIRTVDQLKEDYKNDKNEEGVQNTERLDRVLTEVLDIEFLKQGAESGAIEYSDFQNVLNYLKAKGYKYALGYHGRALAEVTSNASFIIFQDPKAFMKGSKYAYMNSKGAQNLARILSLGKSEQSPRLLGLEMAARLIEQGGLGTESTVGDYSGKLAEAYKSFDKGVDSYQDFLLARPDLVTARAIWIGTFAKEYESITGQKFSLESMTEEVYYNNEERFSNAIRKADDALSAAVASNNPFSGVPASLSKPNDAWYSIFNKYLTRFPRFERANFKKGFDAAASKSGRKDMTRSEGARLVGATAARMLSYNTLVNASAAGLFAIVGSVFGFEDEDDDYGLFSSIYDLFTKEGVEREEAIADFSREIIGLTSMLAFGRMGNFAKTGVNLTTELLNREYGEGITRPKGIDYSSYEHSVSYSYIDPNWLTGDKEPSFKDVSRFTGPYGSFIKSVTESAEWGADYTSETDEVKKEKLREKLMYRILPGLIASTTGMPLKDVQKAGTQYLYSPTVVDTDKEIADAYKEVAESFKDEMGKIKERKAEVKSADEIEKEMDKSRDEFKNITRDYFRGDATEQEAIDKLKSSGLTIKQAQYIINQVRVEDKLEEMPIQIVRVANQYTPEARATEFYYQFGDIRELDDSVRQKILRGLEEVNVSAIGSRGTPNVWFAQYLSMIKKTPEDNATGAEGKD